MKVLIADNLEKEGIDIFKGKSRVRADVYASLSPEELKKKIAGYDGLIVRSASKVTATVVNAAPRLRVIGRAGIGYDNIDVAAASRRGIVVMNTPGANAITTAEHALSLLLALSRHIPQAAASLKTGKWEKKKFMGVEVFNQTLGIIGLGNIGQVVADRARGLKMRVIAFDPFLTEEAMAKRGGDRVTFEELLARSDYITVHTPLTDSTRNLIDARAFKQMKKGVRIINCARGGIVNERDLYDAIKQGIVAGAALDVFEHEPPEGNPLLGLDEVIATPHLGASTSQGQARVAEAIARQVKDYLEKEIITNAVNVPSVSPEMLERVRPYLALAEKMGSFQAQMAEGSIRQVTVEYSGEVAEYDSAPITICLLKGLLERALAEGVNYVNAAPIAKERGIKVSEITTRDSEGFTSLITLRTRTNAGEHSVAGTLFGRGDPRIVRVDTFRTEAVPEGTVLLMHNNDKPGVIGAIGKVLGSREINIAKMHLSRQKIGGVAISLIHVDEPVEEAVLRRLSKVPNVISVKQITL